ncbi:radical SAM protein [Candidatus Desantisbacteria bacterium]|nr:radical SAM protein [Candidatus Desantisbacteria bacterium]
MGPMSLTVSVTYRCNSRCKTCNVYARQADELSVEELSKIFKSIGQDVYWLTISGGEPFLRKDIVEICKSAYENCSPRIINIPTNGILSKIIPGRVEEILQACAESEVIINLSLDGIGKEHDEIRNVKGNFDRAMETYEGLRRLKYPNLTLGIHTVISKFNVTEIPEIYKYVVSSLKPDSFITEIAEQRVELDTMGADITPSFEDYSRAVDFLSERIKENKFSGISRVTQGFRLQYYELVKKILKQRRQIIPCYAGFASAQIAPDGDVWTCCVRASSMGNLREAGYDLKRVWFSRQAEVLRKGIKKGECYCPLANAAYTNMLCNFRSLLRVGLNLTRG